jgi:hypothetical protein
VPLRPRKNRRFVSYLKGTRMHWFDLPPLTEAQTRLQHDAVFGWMDYPDDLQKRDQYFRESFNLIKTIKDQPEKARVVVSSYLHFATDPALRLKLESFLQSLPAGGTEERRTPMIEANDRTFVRLIAELAKPSVLPNAWGDASGDSETVYRTAILRALARLGSSDARKVLTVLADAAPPNETAAAMLVRANRAARELLPALLCEFQSRLNAEAAETNHDNFIRMESDSDPFLENANLTRDSFAGRGEIEPERPGKVDPWGYVT